MANTDQFGRKWELVYAVGATGLDLSELHISFEVEQPAATQGSGVTPGRCFVRVYNLSKGTVAKIRSITPKLVGGGSIPGSSEYARLILQAGYQSGNYGVIFDGPAIQLRSGKESNTDSFLEITGAAWDVPYTFATINRTLAPGATPSGQLAAIAGAMQNQSFQGQTLAVGDTTALGTGGVLPRGKVLWGMAKDHLDALSQTTGTAMVIQNGTLVPVSLTGYLPGQAVQINSATGMVNIPELTQNGLEVTTLLNPKLTIGTRIQVNERDITSSQLTSTSTPEINPATTRFADFAADGFYKVLSVDYEGDTRGVPWYSKITALAIDPSAPPGSSVLKYG